MTSTGYNPSDIKRCAPTEIRKDEVYDGVLRGKVHDEKAIIGFNPNKFKKDPSQYFTAKKSCFR